MSELARYSKLQSKQVAQMNEQIEAKNSRDTNISLRNEWQKDKTSKMYQTTMKVLQI